MKKLNSQDAWCYIMFQIFWNIIKEIEFDFENFKSNWKKEKKLLVDV